MNNLKNTDKFFSRFLKEHDAGRIKILCIQNYHGDGIKPYFDDNILKKAAKYKDIKIIDFTKKPGYTRVNVDMLIDGVKVEFQIGGKHTTRFGEIEHYLYDMRKHGKTNVSKLSLEQKELFLKMKKEYLKIYNDTNKNKLFNEYLTKVWQTLKNAEEKNLPLPVLPKPPKDIPSILSVENLYKLEEKIF